jgi:Rrf2 family protein
VPLSQTAKYALRAMATLASLPPGEAIPAKSLSEFTGIPVHYLSKIMRRLVVAKLVVARKGHGGGFALAQPARRITFAQILAAEDGMLDSTTCAYGWGQCNPENFCPLHQTFATLREALDRWLNQTTLAAVERDPRLLNWEG